MKLLHVLLLSLSLGIAEGKTPAAQPNVIVVLVDDMGFSDIAPYGGEIDTPNLARLAQEGLRFTQFYNSARCCPTRASLMTGLHPHQVGIGHMTTEGGAGMNPNLPAAYQGNLNDSCVTLAQVAKSAGYATFMAGKWHLSGKDPADWPLQRGFDRYYGCLHGATHYFMPYGERIMYAGNQPDPQPKSTSDRPFYTTDAFADHAISFLREHQASERKKDPFFLYLAFTAPHWPLHAHEEELKKYRGRYQMGWDRLRSERYQRQLATGLIPDSWPLTARDPSVPAWDSLDSATQDACEHRMAAYAAMIDRIDQKLGDLIAAVKASGQWENTLFMFMADNGACAEGSTLGLGDPVKERRAGVPLMDISYGTCWANASNTPYRRYKHFTHEGGANTPFIAHWPQRIQAGRDWYRSPAQLIDIMATVVDVTGATYPTERGTHQILPMEGISLLPAFDGKLLERGKPIFLEHEGNASVREGDWKLVGAGVSPAGGLQKKHWELYQLRDDGTEMRDLAATHPDKVKVLSQQWQDWAKRVGVFPKKPQKRKK